MSEISTFIAISFSTIFRFVILVILLTSCTGVEGEAPPDQPIAFNHKIHAGDYRMPCLYCHMYANRSPVAGVPTLKTCMGCHELIGTDKEEIARLTQYWNERRPIEWVKIYDLPDFVRFNHNRHVDAGVDCSKCHGTVAEMEIIQKHSDMSMGWCLACHEEMDAEIDCLVCHH